MWTTIPKKILEEKPKAHFKLANFEIVLPTPFKYFPQITTWLGALLVFTTISST